MLTLLSAHESLSSAHFSLIYHDKRTHTHFRKLVAKFLINLVLIENETNCIMCLVFIHMLKRRLICVWVVCVCECAAIVIIYFMIYISKTLSFNFLFSSRINLISVYICICIIYYSWHIFQKIVFIVWAIWYT